MGAKRSGPGDPADNWQWRMTRSNPEGEWFDSTAPVIKPAPPPLTPSPNPKPNDFHASSFDLLTGLEVREFDAVPIESAEFDALFGDAPPQNDSPR